MLLGKSNQSSIAVLIALQHEEEINEKKNAYVAVVLKDAGQRLGEAGVIFDDQNVHSGPSP